MRKYVLYYQIVMRLSSFHYIRHDISKVLLFQLAYMLHFTEWSIAPRTPLFRTVGASGARKRSSAPCSLSISFDGTKPSAGKGSGKSEQQASVQSLDRVSPFASNHLE